MLLVVLVSSKAKVDLQALQESHDYRSKASFGKINALNKFGSLFLFYFNVDLLVQVWSSISTLCSLIEELRMVEQWTRPQIKMHLGTNRMALILKENGLRKLRLL